MIALTLVLDRHNEKEVVQSSCHEQAGEKDLASSLMEVAGDT